MVLLKNFVNIFVIPELRKKFLFTLGVLVVYRLGCHIPVIGVNTAALKALIDQREGILGKIFSYIDMFSGGELGKSTIFSLGIMPYISSSIVMQMLGLSIPSLQALMKEGEYGRKIINQYTRYLTFVISVTQGLAYAVALERSGSGIVVAPGWGFRFMFILSVTVGSMFVMWLGEQISQFGLGNGSSIIIFAGIVARYPADFSRTWHLVRSGIMNPIIALLLLGAFIAIAACIVFLERGERKVPVQYARRVVGQRVYGGQSTYIPFKLNTAGVMPIIFAGAILQLPQFIFMALAPRFAIFETLRDVFMPGGIVYLVLMFLLIIAMSFYYTALVFDPEELADNIKKGGGYIPGVRPGRKTAEFFNHILTRLGFIGALYLAVLAMTPYILYAIFKAPFMETGTGLLIVVGVALDMAAQIESYLIEHRYEGFLTAGRLKGRWGN